ncbi:rhodanese-like domain-containing protein [Salegentibacter sp. F188]|uniref:Rhodanese-like domain-containing protein n=1 Tax=Autumnicola patrickiae TaxID=3075591 RepID=A0ABU3DZ79_9FLAO|nr:rhodanese-like domain-containing protein [Salegentibacter sp. F188]MDT0689026.1 rhodanese-like domain-containing protein [Salegentibacter sp. F188]
MYILKSLFGFGSRTNTKIEILKKSQFKKHLLETRGLLIDVRTPKEFVEDHIENARNINFYDSRFLTRVKDINKDKPVFIYCRNGARSARAAKKMVKQGFSQIYELKGGFLAWQK